MSPPVRLRPVDKMEMRLMREADAKVKECASYFGVSVPTTMRALADLRRRLGPEKFKAETGKQRARSHLYDSHIARNAQAEPDTQPPATERKEI